MRTIILLGYYAYWLTDEDLLGTIFAFLYALISSFVFCMLIIGFGEVIFLLQGIYDKENDVSYVPEKGSAENLSNSTPDGNANDNSVNTDSFFYICCPHCHQTISCKEEWRNQEIICPCCQNQFTL